MKKPDCYGLFYKHCNGACLSNYNQTSYSFNKVQKILLKAGFILSSNHGSHWVYRHPDLTRHPQMTNGFIEFVAKGGKRSKTINQFDMKDLCKAIKYLYTTT